MATSAKSWRRFFQMSKESLKRALGVSQRLNGREIEMRVLAIAAIITSLAVPAFAAEDPAKAEANKAEEQKKKESEEIDKAYKDTLKKTTREQPVKKADPWGGAR